MQLKSPKVPLSEGGDQPPVELVTAWDLWDRIAEDFFHNHLEPGHATTSLPANPHGIPGWSKGRWRARHCVLVPSTRYPGSKRVVDWFPGDELDSQLHATQAGIETT